MRLTGSRGYFHTELHDEKLHSGASHQQEELSAAESVAKSVVDKPVRYTLCYCWCQRFVPVFIS